MSSLMGANSSLAASLISFSDVRPSPNPLTEGEGDRALMRRSSLVFHRYSGIRNFKLQKSDFETRHFRYTDFGPWTFDFGLNSKLETRNSKLSDLPRVRRCEWSQARRRRRMNFPPARVPVDFRLGSESVGSIQGARSDIEAMIPASAQSA